ncbi:MAG TPA: PaaI family thioesterase [Gaiellaceae bacterium]|nr:PaaI family thioesterase [Gaiellaceae bacterium]
MARRRGWGDEAPPSPHIWLTLGYRSVEQKDGVAVIEWEATPDYCFHDGAGGHIVHGGMVTTLLDTAMGGACWSVLEDDESFLTADLHAEFVRSARPGVLRAEGRVVRRNRRVAFCAADLYDAAGELLASSRCTQIIRNAATNS